MNEQDKTRFAELLAATMDVYARDASSNVAAIWWESLKRFEFAEIRAAFSRHIQDTDSGQYAPKPAEIIRILEGGDTEGRALVAWTKVLEGMRLVGPYQSVVFDDPLIHTVIEDMGGWIGLCEMSDEHVPFRGREFQTRYRAAVHCPPERYPAQLTGVSEGQNRSHGHAHDEAPVLIGDTERARAVLAGGSSAPRVELQRASESAAKALPEGEESAGGGRRERLSGFLKAFRGGGDR